MTDDELMILKKLNAERTQNEKNIIMDEFYKMDSFIQEELKKNAKHYTFDTEIELQAAMMKDYNPYNTFGLK
jgi:hypothetical protein